METKDEKTHYRKAFNSPYLSAADIVEPMTFQVKRVSLDEDKTKKTKDHFNTIYWVEKEIRAGEELKPMILNATNSRTLKNLTGSPYIDDWGGTHVTVYVDPSVRFGRDTVEGLRISSEKPKIRKPELLPGTPAWTRAVDVYKKKASFEDILKHMEISEANKEAIIKEAATPAAE